MGVKSALVASPTGLGAPLPPRLPPGHYTIAQGLQSQSPGGFFGVMLQICAGLSWASDATHTMIFAFLGPSLRCNYNLAASQEALVLVTLFGGTMIGSVAWGHCSDAYGRKSALRLSSGLTLIATLAMAFAPSYAAVLVASVFVGGGLGGAGVTFSLFTECVPARSRAMGVVGIELSWTIGAIVASAIAQWTLASHGWRTMLVCCVWPIVVVQLMLMAIPESPRWLLLQGRTSEARQALEWMARVNRRPLPGHSLFSPSSRSPPGPAQPRSAWDSWLSAKRQYGKITSHTMRQTTVILGLLWFVVTALYYGLVFFVVTLQSHSSAEPRCTSGGHAALFSGDDFRDVMLNTLAELPGLIACVLVVDVVGRKPTLLWSLAAAAIAMAPLFVYRLAAIFVFLPRMFMSCASAVLDMYSMEVYRTDVRSFAFGNLQLVGKLGSLFSPFVAVELASRWPVGAAAVLAALMALAAAGSHFLKVETMGQELQDESDEVAGHGGDHDEALESGRLMHATADGKQALPERVEAVGPRKHKAGAPAAAPLPSKAAPATPAPDPVTSSSSRGHAASPRIRALPPVQGLAALNAQARPSPTGQPRAPPAARAMMAGPGARRSSAGSESSTGAARNSGGKPSWK